jgi:uncharacterized protein YodC (DUF2158 family)
VSDRLWSLDELVERTSEQMTMRFKTGNIVVLKSGGPEMTIVSATDEGFSCIWFVGKRRSRETFPAEALRKHRKASTRPPNFRISFVNGEGQVMSTHKLRDGKLDPPPN